MNPEHTDYQSLAAEALDSGFSLSIAEAHGQICGMLCSHADDFRPLWQLALLLDESDDSEAGGSVLRQSLQALFDFSKQGFESPEHSVRPLLPDAEQPLAIRALAVRDWCAGFAAGFELGGLQKPQDLSEQAQEALLDIQDIGRMDLRALEEEKSESPLTELEEYIWVATSLIWLSDNSLGESNVTH